MRLILWGCKIVPITEKPPVPFFTNANVTQMFFSMKCFFQKTGASALRLRGHLGPTPVFWKKTFHGKEYLCNVCVCKKWDWWFLKNLAVLIFWICACLSIFRLTKKLNSYLLDFHRFQKSASVLFLLVRSSARKCIHVSILSLKKIKFFLFEFLFGFC